MSTPRLIRNLAFLLLLAGLIVGSISDHAVLPAPPRASGYYILTGDFHVHAFPGDGALTGWDLRAEARRRRLDVITVSNHNQTIAARIADRFNGGSERPIVIRGQEITAPRFHIIALGVESEIGWDSPAAVVIDAVHSQGGVAIAAHPTSDFWSGYDSAAIARLDGTEAAHPTAKDGNRMDLLSFYNRALHRDRPIAAIGSSDYHFGGPLGICRTVLFVSQVSRDGVLEAIRAGRTVAVDLNGAMYGDSALIRLIDRQAISDTRELGLFQIVGRALVWAGLFGVALFGGVRRTSVLS
jgi:hypothetical protein